MQNNISNALWPFQIYHDAFRPYKCTCCFSTLDEWCLLQVSRWFHGLLHQWHPHFLQECGGPKTTCMSYFGQAQRSWILCQIEKVWIYLNQSGILGLHHL